MTVAAQAIGEEPDLIARREGAVGVIRLNRPKAINAVTLEMFRDVDKALDAFEEVRLAVLKLKAPKPTPRSELAAAAIDAEEGDEE